MVQKRRSVLAMVRMPLLFPAPEYTLALRSGSQTATSEGQSFVRTRRASWGRPLRFASFIAKLVRLQFPKHSANQYAGGVRNEGAFDLGCRSEVMTGCLLVGASYALLNTQTHAVGAVAAVGVEDSKVRASIQCWSDRNRFKIVIRISWDASCIH